MIKRYHEAPIAIFKQVQELTDGDYALVHLFETNPTYYAMFKQAVADGRDVILDNSLFELGTAFDGDKYAEWIKQLQPTWYIVPDSWKNGEKTCEMFFDFLEKHPGLPGKIIGVAQGKTVEEVAQCYKEIEPFCDMVGFSLDFSSVYYDAMPGMVKAQVPYCVAMSYGRYMVLNTLQLQGVINPNKEHHLLGCGVPQEVQWYPAEWTWIRSVDTSNPVVHGMHNQMYGPMGLSHKIEVKMCDMINYGVDVSLMWNIRHNIQLMKSWCQKWEGPRGGHNSK